MVVRMQLILPGGMRIRPANLIVQALVIAAGACSTIYSSGCMYPLRHTIIPDWTRVHDDENKSSVAHTRFKDTLRIVLGVPNIRSLSQQESSNKDSLSWAIQLCEQGNRLEGQQILLRIVESRSQSDSLYWEALYQLGECNAVAGNAQQALRFLGEIAYRSEGVPTDIHARAIVRTGHVFCMLSRKGDAAEQFARLVKLYPNSPYRALADCSIIH